LPELPSPAPSPAVVEPFFGGERHSSGIAKIVGSSSG
jgi:hypothetical protein